MLKYLSFPESLDISIEIIEYYQSKYPTYSNKGMNRL